MEDVGKVSEPSQSAEERRDPLIGAQIGHYRVLGTIGEGGMGTVYLGEHPEIGSRVAIKVLASHLSANPEMAKRFMAEARAANRINHPGIIRVFDLGRLEDGRLYMIMELLDGEELRTYLQTHAPLNVAETRDLLEQIAGALDAAHNSGIVHRDLKPANVYLHRSGKKRIAKILDFGIAKLVEGTGLSIQKTATGMVMGTPLYMAPEQAAGEVDKISPRTDIYALGVILYEMLSGEYPIQGPNPAIILAAHIASPPVPLETVTKNLPTDLCRVVMRCLEKRPEDRFPSAGAVLAAFDSAMVGTSWSTRADVLAPPGMDKKTIAYGSAPSWPFVTGPQAGSPSVPGVATGPQIGGPGPQAASFPPGYGLDSQASGSHPMAEPGTTGGQEHAASPPARKVLLIGGIGLGVLGVAIAAITLSHRGGSHRSRVKVSHPATGSSPSRPQGKPAANGPAKQPPLVLHTVRFLSQEPNVTARVQVGKRPAVVHAVPFSIEAPEGASIHVYATRPGYPPQAQDFRADADTDVRLVFASPLGRSGQRAKGQTRRPRARAGTSRARPSGHPKRIASSTRRHGSGPERKVGKHVKQGSGRAHRRRHAVPRKVGEATLGLE